MRRDIGNEVVVAIVAVLVLALALVFGVILSLSNNESRGVVNAPTGTAGSEDAAGEVTEPADAVPTMDMTALSGTLFIGTEVVQLLTASAEAVVPSATATPPLIDLPATSAPDTDTPASPATRTPRATDAPATETAPAPTSAPDADTPASPGTRTPRATDAPVSAAETRQTTASVSASPMPTERATIGRPTREVTATGQGSETLSAFAVTATALVQALAANTAPQATGTAQIVMIASDTPEPSPSSTATATAEPSDTPAPTRTNTRQPTSTLSATPSVTPTLTPSRTNTPRPSATSTVTPSPTATPTNTATASITPSRTFTATHTATNTAMRTNTATPFLTSTLTPSQTSTPRPSATSTVTPSLTATPTPSSTNTPRPTATSTATPSATASSTPTQTASPTHTVTPSRTPTHTPTVTRTLIVATAMELSGNLPIPTALVTPEFLCALPFGWTTYVVQAGDTLYAIAEAAQTSVRALREANCLANIATLPVGLPLYVPNPVTGTPPTLQPVLPSSTPRPEDVQLALNLPAEGCTDPQARITSPVPGQVAGSMLTLFGTADSPRFAAYRLSVRSAATAAYSEYLIALQPVNGEALGQINPLFFGPGIHYVRLDVLDESGDPLAFCAIPVIFR